VDSSGSSGTILFDETQDPPEGFDFPFGPPDGFDYEDGPPEGYDYEGGPPEGFGPSVNQEPESYDFSPEPLMFKSIDGGSTWDKFTPSVSQVNVIEIHPTDHEKIYVGADDGIYLSTDSGKTLKQIKSSNGSVISIEVQKDNPNNIVAASPSKIFKSIDAGNNWSEITGRLSDIHRVRISRSNPNIFYASTFNGVFRSDDFGETWVDRSGNLKSKNIQIVTIHPRNPDIVFVGHSSLWSSVRAEERYQGGLLAHQGVFKSIDGGINWFRSDNGIEEFMFEEVATNPNIPNEAWFTAPASRGGYKTEDAGHNWRTTQIQTLHYPMRLKFSLQDAKRVYATSWHNGGPFALSTDGGVNWQLTMEPAFFNGLNRGKSLFDSERGMGGAIHVHGLAIDPNNDQIVYSGSVSDVGTPVFFPLAGAHLWKSANAGKTWKESDEGFPHESKTSVHDIKIDPKNTSIIYAATTKHESKIGIGIYKSVDAGNSWKEINNGLENLSVGALVINPNRTNELVAATLSGLFKSYNSGESWEKKSNAGSFDVEYVIENPNIVYASGNEGVFKSKDFGDTWFKTSLGLPRGEGKGIGVDPTGNVIFTAIDEEGVFVARLIDVAPIDPVSEVGSGYGYGGDFPFPDFGNGFPFPDFDFDPFGGADQPSGPPEGIDIDKIPDAMIKQECQKTTWPPICSIIPDETGKKLCEKCKQLESKGVIDSETKQADELDIFDAIIKFFTGLFEG